MYQTATSTVTEHCGIAQPFEPISNHVPVVEMLGSNINPSYQNLIGQSRVNQNALPVDDRSLFPDTIIQSNYCNKRCIAATYQISELERFGSGNGESLTLGLQGGSLPVSDETRCNFVTVRGNDVYNTSTSSKGLKHRDLALWILQTSSINLSHRVLYMIL